MSFARRPLLSLAAVFTLSLALSLLPVALTAQDHAMAEGEDGASTFGEDFPHGVTFWSRREPVGCWLCAPSVDINGGLYMVEATPEDISTSFFRLHTQWGLGIKHIALSADLLWRGHGGSSAVLVAQYEPISQRSRFYASAGLGVIDDNDGFWNWGQATVAYRSPIHDLAPFVMAGKVLGESDQEVQLFFGIAHPIAPYRMH